jgi:hypothetical protein
MNQKPTIKTIAAESIAGRTGIRSEAIQLWAETHNIDIMYKGYILVRPENLNKLIHDVSNNVFQELKGII